MSKEKYEVEFEKLEHADSNLCKAVFAYLDALGQVEETTDVAELYRNTRQYTPDITISKSAIQAWAALKGKTD